MKDLDLSHLVFLILTILQWIVSSIKDLALAHLALPILIILLCIVVRQQIFILPRLRKDLIELNKRRASLVSGPLAASTAATWMEPGTGPVHPFAGSVTLHEDGTLSIGGELLRPSGEFHVTARDQHHIPRAVAICKGNGKVLISSHGQEFLVRFENGEWNVSRIS